MHAGEGKEKEEDAGARARGSPQLPKNASVDEMERMMREALEARQKKKDEEKESAQARASSTQAASINLVKGNIGSPK